jgi:tetratricopeptide (TPR) repeat protein
MPNLLRSRFSAAAIIFVFTVGACCSPSEPTDPCTGAADTAAQGMDDMEMSSTPSTSHASNTAKTQACGLANLVEKDPDPPLYPGIGSAHWHVPWGQEYFDQGLRFFFAFNSRESLRAFRKAAHEAEDRKIPCSACYWAQALALGVDINMQNQSEPDQVAAKALLHRAIDANPSLLDWQMIQALFGRYQDCIPEGGKDNGKQCQEIRNRAYYAGMKRVVEMHGSDDPNVMTLFADSAMNLAPWAYWEKDGSPVRNVAEPITEARRYLEKALNFVRYPPNEGPIHWYIHLMEQSPWPDAAERYADQLGLLAPNAGHLVHMPSHIYYRMGDMRKAINVNKSAIDADERYFHTEPGLSRPDNDRYTNDYYFHNIRFLIAAAMLGGDNKDANDYAEKLLQLQPDKAKGRAADVPRTIYYLAKVKFSTPAEIRNLAQPNSSDQPLANVAYDYARFMADIWGKSDFKQSKSDFDNDLANYRTGQQNVGCDKPPGVSRSTVCLTAILSNLVDAEVETSSGNWDKAVAAAERAMVVQDALGYMEPPLWPYPVRQTLASILIRRADADHSPDPENRRTYLSRARDLLLTSLNKSSAGIPNTEIRTETFPGNGWAYYGLWEIAKRDGSSLDAVGEAEVELKSHWFGIPEIHTLERM